MTSHVGIKTCCVNGYDMLIHVSYCIIMGLCCGKSLHTMLKQVQTVHMSERIRKTDRQRNRKKPTIQQNNDNLLKEDEAKGKIRENTIVISG